MEITLRAITEENFRAVVDMKLPPEQHFVAPNVLSLAQAWLHREEARPFAVYDGDTLVGFLMLDWDEAARELGIWRLMIAPEFQGCGRGQETVRRVIEMGRASGKFDTLYLDYVPDNQVGEHIYTKLGFRPTGEIEDGEIVMALPLT